LFTIELVASTAIPAFAQSGTWSKTGSMNTARESHTATLLQNGQVLVARGVKQDQILPASRETLVLEAPISALPVK